MVSPTFNQPLTAEIGDRQALLQEIVGRILRRTPHDGTHATAVPRLSVIRFSQPSKPLDVLHEPALCFVVQGRKRLMLGPEVFVYDPTEYLAVSVALPLTGEILDASDRNPYLCLRIDLDPSVLCASAAHVPSNVPGRLSHGAGLALAQLTPDLLGAVLRLVRLLDSPEDIPALSSLTEREILYRVLKDDRLPLLRQIAAASAPSQQVGRALTWLKHHFAEPFDMRQLAQEARMSPSALYEHFRAITTMSPLQYQKQLRLQEARRLLLGGRITAASAGYAVGYDSPSQFGREYRRCFGLSPARDVGQLRAQRANAFGT